MKKQLLILLLAITPFYFATASSNEVSLKTGISANDYPLDNGFLLRAGIGITSEQYGLPDDLDYEDIPSYTLGLEFGNQWYVWRHTDETMGFAINVNWIDMQYGAKSEGGNSYGVVNIGLIEFGPMYTIAPTDDIGIDLFFNFRPTIFGTLIATSEDDGRFDAGFGLTYAPGVTFRWNAFLVGVEYGFGKVNVAGSGEFEGDAAGADFDEKLNTGLFKINIGVKL